jgi:hypothetical protein
LEASGSVPLGSRRDRTRHRACQARSNRMERRGQFAARVKTRGEAMGRLPLVFWRV